MKRVRILCLAFVLEASGALAADGTARHLKEAVFPGGSTIVVVAEGDFEPRSVGSYSLRIYARTNPAFPHDNFVVGTVRPRDGVVESVTFADLDNDGGSEIVVVMRSAGSGSTLSADAFRLDGANLTLRASVSSLAKDADPVRALEGALLPRAGH